MNFVKFTINKSMVSDSREAKKSARKILKPYRRRFLLGAIVEKELQYDFLSPGNICEYELECLKGVGYEISAYEIKIKDYFLMIGCLSPIVLFIINRILAENKESLKRFRPRIL